MKNLIHSNKVSRTLIALDVMFALLYFSWWLIPGRVGNPYLYALLLLGEMYHIIVALTFWFTIWPGRRELPKFPETDDFNPSVDVFITVCGEPAEIVKNTILAAKNINYANHKVYVLNDGYIAQKENWREIIHLGEDLGAEVITRKTGGRTKAENINNALRQTQGELVAIFDADMVASENFLTETVPYFLNEGTGFVQSPQYYGNHKDNEVTETAWNQQELFFGPIMRGKDKSNAAFICGTNVLIRRTALIEAGGMREDNIAEDFLTSLYIHANGWKSYYIPRVLATGFAPFNLLDYEKQQFRWARGSLEVLFSENPFFKKGLTFAQRVEYLSSGLFYLNGIIVAIDIITPLIVLFTGIVPVATTTTSFALFFIPYIVMSLFTIYVVSNKQYTFRAQAFTQSNFVLQLRALKAVIFREKSSFTVTPKEKESGIYPSLVYPHIAYLILTVVGIGFALFREGLNPSVAANAAWAALNSVMFLPFILVAFGITFGEQPVKVPAKGIIKGTPATV